MKKGVLVMLPKNLVVKCALFLKEIGAVGKNTVIVLHTNNVISALVLENDKIVNYDKALPEEHGQTYYSLTDEELKAVQELDFSSLGTKISYTYLEIIKEGLSGNTNDQQQALKIVQALLSNISSDVVDVKSKCDRTFWKYAQGAQYIPDELCDAVTAKLLEMGLIEFNNSVKLNAFGVLKTEIGNQYCNITIHYLSHLPTLVGFTVKLRR